MTFDLDIWRAGSPWHYLLPVTSNIQVQGNNFKSLKENKSSATELADRSW